MTGRLVDGSPCNQIAVAIFLGNAVTVTSCSEHLTATIADLTPPAKSPKDAQP